MQSVESGSTGPKFHVSRDTGNLLPLNVSVGVVAAMSAHGTAGRQMKLSCDDIWTRRTRTYAVGHALETGNPCIVAVCDGL